MSRSDVSNAFNNEDFRLFLKYDKGYAKSTVKEIIYRNRLMFQDNINEDVLKTRYYKLSGSTRSTYRWVLKLRNEYEKTKNKTVGV